MSVFDKVEVNQPKKSAFNLSHEVKMSAKMGNLYPILCQEVLPGDKFKIRTESLVRFAPLLAPLMHRVDYKTYFFYVPNRLIYKDWENFITGGREGDLIPVPPTARCNVYPTPGGGSGNYLKDKSLLDYMGIPTIAPDFVPGTTHQVEFNLLPFAAYQLIYEEWFRDQNNQEDLSDVEIPLVSGYYTQNGANQQVQLEALFKMQKVNWERDYFTSALPWTQRGEPVTIPLTGYAPVVLTTDPSIIMSGIVQSGQTINNASQLQATDILNGNPKTRKFSVNDGGTWKPAAYNPNGTLEVDLSNAEASTINQLRQAFQIQKWLERQARSGARYVETILSHFGVRSSDSRLQRPEFLGGKRAPVQISEVLQTSATDDNTTPLAQMAGHAFTATQDNSVNHSFEEHGFIIGLMVVQPRTAYQQGMHRMFFRNTKFDYYWPEFAHLGEQEVKNKELYYDYGQETDNDGTFGYQARFAEYRYQPSRVCGDFKDQLNFWHLGRIFSNKPTLSEDWNVCNPDNRIFAVQDNIDNLWIQIYHEVIAIRSLPKLGNPGLIDH